MQLVIQSGTLTGQTFELLQDVTIIGRDEHCDIQLHDPAVSRRHAQIERLTNGFILTDLGAVNGTLINNILLDAPYQLHAGDMVRLGETFLLAQEVVLEGNQIWLDPGGVDFDPLQREAITPPPTANRRPVLAAASGVLGGVILIGLILLGLNYLMAPVTGGLFAPTAVAVVSVTPTAMPTARIDTPIPQVQIDSKGSPSPPPSLTRTQTPTTVPPTLPPTLAATPISPTRRSVTIIPTLAPPTEPRVYNVLRVLSPPEHYRFNADSAVAFSWVPAENLNAADFYRVQIARNADFKEIACTLRTRNTSAVVGGEGTHCTPIWVFGQRFFWRVQVVTMDDAGTEFVLDRLPATLHDFVWQ